MRWTVASSDEFICFGGTMRHPVTVASIALNNKTTKKIIEACRHVHTDEDKCIKNIYEVCLKS